MTVRPSTRRGKRRLIIDIRFTRPDGNRDRYRRDAVALTKAAALLEEQRIRQNIAAFGSPFAPKMVVEEPAHPPTFAEVVENYRRIYMPSVLKPTTTRGYNSVIDHHLLPRFGALEISSVNREVVWELDRALAARAGRKRRKLAKGTKNNVQVVLRSILSFAADEGYLAERPRGLPKLLRPSQRVLDIPTDEQIDATLSIANPAQERSLGILAFAGLRPHEARALRAGSVKLVWSNGHAIGGRITVRDGVSHGEAHEPKTGERVVPVAPRLARLLAPVSRAPRDSFVALTSYGKPWGQYGLDQVFQRLAGRAGIAGFTSYTLRHYAITAWLRAGIPIHVVQRMAGHASIATTQLYLHLVAGDLDDAASKMGNIWVTPAE